MSNERINEALAHIRKLQNLALPKSFFNGYSGRARFLGGCLALVGAVFLDSKSLPADPNFHLRTWAALFACALVLNYGRLLHWFWYAPDARRDPIRLKPAHYAFPSLAVGVVLTFILAREGLYHILPGLWMCHYGLAQVTYRRFLPSPLYHVGLAYLFLGFGFLLFGGFAFTNPWPVGILFFTGETLGGWFLMKAKAKQVPQSESHG